MIYHKKFKLFLSHLIIIKTLKWDTIQFTRSFDNQINRQIFFHIPDDWVHIIFLDTNYLLLELELIFKSFLFSILWEIIRVFQLEPTFFHTLCFIYWYNASYELLYYSTKLKGPLAFYSLSSERDEIDLNPCTYLIFNELIIRFK